MKLQGTGWHAAPNSLYDGTLSSHEAVVLGYLYRRAGPDGCSWPSVARIAKDCRLGATTVRMVLSALEYGGRLERTERDGGTTIYRVGDFVPHRVAMPSPSPADAPTPSRGEGEVLSIRTRSPLIEVSPLHPPGGESKDIGLLTAKETLLKDAREVVLAIGKHHGWLLTGSQVKKQMPFVLELFRMGIPKQFIIDQACKLDKLFTIEHLHSRIRWQDLQIRQVDPAIQEMIDRIWGGGDDDGRDRGAEVAEVQVPGLPGQGD